MERETILKKVVTPEELCIVKIFNFLNWEFINKDYRIGNDDLDKLIEYIKTRDKNYLDEVWSKNSVQKKYFLNIIKICEFYESNPTLEERGEFYIENCEELLELEERIYRIYILTKGKEKEKLYDDENFSIYLIESREDEKNINYYDEDVFFHIILDGVILLKNERLVLTADDIYFSRELPYSQEFLPVNNEYKKLIFIIKKDFLTATQIKINNAKNKKINYIGSRNLILSLMKKEGANLNETYIFQIAIYLLELFNTGKVEITNPPFVELKRKIVNIMDNNICLDKKVIIDILMDELNVSSSKLYKIFYTLFGSSASKYIDKLKLDKACYYLQQPKQSIEDISYKVGMSEQTFLRKFYEEFEVTPANFVKGVEENVESVGKESDQEEERKV